MNKIINLLLCSLFFSGCGHASKATLSLSNPTKKDFYQHLTTAPLLTTSQIRLGIIPHHEVAKTWISEFWATVGAARPHCVIMISPNHFDVDKEKVIIAQNSWETSVGTIESNVNIVNSLKKLPFVVANPEAVSKDHGITTHIPYIAHFLPNTKIVTMLVSNYVNEKEITMMVDTLKQKLDPTTDIVVASIDFSHYLSKEDSEKKDEVTRALIEKGESDRIINLNNDYLDARSGMVLVQQLAVQFGCSKPTFFHHGNSADFLNGPTENTTSYFVIGYTADNCQQSR